MDISNLPPDELMKLFAGLQSIGKPDDGCCKEAKEEMHDYYGIGDNPHSENTLK